MPVELRPCREDDEDFLFGLYASTRTEELDAWGWDEQRRVQFLTQQFQAQRQSYRIQFAGADHQIITDNGRPIGRVMLWRTEDEYRLVDIALLPRRRNEGIGTRLLCRLRDEAFAARKPVRLSVLRTSPAVGLYERLGFTVTCDDGVYLQMEASRAQPRIP